MRKSTLSIPAIALTLSFLVGGHARPDESSVTYQTVQAQPNILLIMADDLGYSDLSSYGSEIPTPHLDKLAEGGLRFSRFYTGSMCAVTRPMLFSGLEYSAGGNRLSKGVSMAKLLRDAGYHTSMVGKNHGMNDPMSEGFQRFWGYTGGQANSFTGAGNVQWQSDNNTFPASQLPDDYYSTETFTVKAIEFMGQAINNNTPFFSYVAFTAPHTPLGAPERNVRKFYDPDNGVNLYAAGWDALRVQKLARMKALGILPGTVKLSEPGVEIPAWDKLPATSNNNWEMQKGFEALERSAYAGMVDNIDENVGKMVAFLEDPDGDGNKSDSKLNNTLILFLSDNGGCYAGIPSPRNSLPWIQGNFTTNFGWGTLSNTPFRYYKHASHEGGIRSPLVVHWPQGISVPGGTILHQMATLWDIYPTLIQVAGAEYPATYEGKTLKALMGNSLTPLLSNSNIQTEDYYVSSFSRSRSLIKENWKIVTYWDGPWELYDLQNDPSERYNLAATQSDKLNEVVNLWNNYARDNGFSESTRFNPEPGNKIRGWGFHNMRSGMTEANPEYMSKDNPVDVKLTFKFSAAIDFNNTAGKTIRLQKYGIPGAIWESDPDASHPSQGKTTVVFNDFPRLDSSSHYSITWDDGWVNINGNPIGQVRDSPWAYRFKTAGDAVTSISRKFEHQFPRISYQQQLNFLSTN